MARGSDAVAKRMGVVIRNIREEQGLTQEEVAVKYGATDGAIAAYEQGRSRFTVQDLPSLADSLGVPIAYLSRRLGLCGDDSPDIATALVTRFGPQVGTALVRLDRVLAHMEHGDTAALAVLVGRMAAPYESSLNA